MPLETCYFQTSADELNVPAIVSVPSQSVQLLSISMGTTENINLVSAQVSKRTIIILYSGGTRNKFEGKNS